MRPIKKVQIQSKAFHVFLLFLGVFPALVLVGCGIQKHTIEPTPLGFSKPVKPEPSPELSVAQQIQADAFGQMGLPYRYGGNSPKTGFDCAGLTQWTHKNHGFKLGRSSKDQLTGGRKIERRDIRPGDLVFYKERGYTHVGIYIGNGNFIHSPHTGDVVKVSSAFDKYHAARFLGARRYHNDPNPKALPTTLRESIIRQAQARNKKGVSVAAKSEKPAKTKITRKYKVKKGDTIHSLSRRFKVPQDRLLKANKIKKTTTLKIGQVLIIPDA